jgi:hypothetical protein
VISISKSGVIACVKRTANTKKRKFFTPSTYRNIFGCYPSASRGQGMFFFKGHNSLKVCIQTKPSHFQKAGHTRGLFLPHPAPTTIEGSVSNTKLVYSKGRQEQKILKSSNLIAINVYCTDCHVENSVGLKPKSTHFV